MFRIKIITRGFEGLLSQKLVTVDGLRARMMNKKAWGDMMGKVRPSMTKEMLDFLFTVSVQLQ